MDKHRPDPKSHFESGGGAYADHRPSYPARLISDLVALTRAQDLCVDVGCGTGQLSVPMADHFANVVACDVSESQIAHASPHGKVAYHIAPAHRIPAKNATADLILAAQAAHWFDLNTFYPEVRRIAAPGAILALISYGVLYIDGPVSERFNAFYWDDLSPHWPAERRHVETKYAELPFPFEELHLEPVSIVRHWKLADFLGYLDTWSAVQAAKRKEAAAIVEAFYNDATQLWGDPEKQQRIEWPINTRIGRL